MECGITFGLAKIDITEMNWTFRCLPRNLLQAPMTKVNSICVLTFFIQWTVSLISGIAQIHKIHENSSQYMGLLWLNYNEVEHNLSQNHQYKISQRMSTEKQHNEWLSKYDKIRYIHLVEQHSGRLGNRTTAQCHIGVCHSLRWENMIFDNHLPKMFLIL